MRDWTLTWETAAYLEVGHDLTTTSVREAVLSIKGPSRESDLGNGKRGGLSTLEMLCLSSEQRKSC